MDTPLITMTPDEADRRMKAYRDRLGKMKGKKVSQEIATQYEAIMQGYKALRKGTPLIDIDEAIKVGGFDVRGRPQLAICQARRKVVTFAWERGSASFHPLNTYREQDYIRIPMKCPESAIKGRNKDGYAYYWQGHARVPLVPADVRPRFGNEKDWHVLWEVEEWADEARQVIPDRDPYLLKHLGGSLYAVIAEWDLTDLERAVMKQSNLAT